MAHSTLHPDSMEMTFQSHFPRPSLPGKQRALPVLKTC